MSKYLVEKKFFENSNNSNFIIRKKHIDITNFNNLTFSVIKKYFETKVQLSFDSQGGNILENKEVILGKPYGQLPIPAKTQNIFIGWFTDITGGTQITSETLVSLDINILYAHWEEIQIDQIDPNRDIYLCFTAEEANSTISMSTYGSAPTVYLETSPTTAFGSWSDFVVNSTIITLANVSDKIYFRAKQDNEIFATSTSAYNKFIMTGKITASGNLNTLLKADGSVIDLTGRNYCYSNMFNGCTSLIQAPALPATTLINWCYYSMFVGCSALTTAPELPATTLANYCYFYMFDGCSSLTQAPKILPATTLASSCYNRMFSNCTALTQAPKILPATTLASSCYNRMFSNCTALTQAPALPATTLANYCYRNMFQNCYKLNNINVNFSAWNPTDAIDVTDSWVYGVSSSGTFTCPADLPETYGTSYIPTGWTVVRK